MEQSLTASSLINDEIEKLRLSATSSLLTGRRDIIVVASVSCIYGLGDPESYMKMLLHLRQGDTMDQRDILRRLAELQYKRNDAAFQRGTFRVRGDVVEIFPQYEAERAIRAIRKRIRETQQPEGGTGPAGGDPVADTPRNILMGLRDQEREIMRIAIKVCGMPRKEFINTFQGSEADLKWVSRQARKKEYGPKLTAEKETIHRLQRRIQQIEEHSGLTVTEIKEILKLLLEKNDQRSEMEKKIEKIDEAINEINNIKDAEQRIKDETDAIKNSLSEEEKAKILVPFRKLLMLRSLEGK